MDSLEISFDETDVSLNLSLSADGFEETTDVNNNTNDVPIPVSSDSRPGFSLQTLQRQKPAQWESV